MKLVISGAPGTGKTTLGNLLGQHTCLKYFSEIEERVAVEMGFRNIGHLRDVRGREGLVDNFFLSLDKKIAEERDGENYVADKSIYDVGARWFGRLWEGVTSEQHNRVRGAMKEFAQRKVYDRVIYLPLHLARAVENDGLRSTDFEARYQRSLLIRGLFVEYGIEYESYDYSFSDPPEKVLRDLRLEEFKKG